MEQSKEDFINQLSVGHHRYFVTLLKQKNQELGLDLNKLEIDLLAELSYSKQLTIKVVLASMYKKANGDFSFIDSLIEKGLVYYDGYNLRVAERLIDDNEYSIGQMASCPLPLIEEPRNLKHNNDSIYDANIGGVVSNLRTKADVNLDCLNEMQHVKLKLTDVAMLSNVPNPLYPEVKQFTDTGTEFQTKRADAFRKILANMLYKDEAMYFSWFYDRRGRFYDHGYHFHIQGTEFEKACLELGNEEIVELKESDHVK